MVVRLQQATMAKGEITRTRIVEQAAALFNKYGLAGVSISDIMAATKLKKGGIYRHFESKESIAIAAFDYNYGQMTQRLTRHMRGAKSQHERLTRFIMAFANLSEMIDGGCPVLNTAVEHDDNNPQLRQRACDAATSWHKLLVRILDRGIQSNEFQSDIKVESVATFIVSALEGAIMLARLHNERIYAEQVVDQLLQYIDTQVFRETIPDSRG
jgi:TetR/AcrR family transcriptional repressor of nem operon